MNEFSMWPKNQYYQERLKEIFDAAKKLEQSFEHRLDLTLHDSYGESYSFQIESIISRILPGNRINILSDDEKFHLLSAIRLHHIGLISGIFKEDYGQNSSYIRWNHHSRAEKLIIDQGFKFGLHENEINIIGIIVRFHSDKLSLSECPRIIPYKNSLIRVRLLAALLQLSILFFIPSDRSPKKEKTKLQLHKNLALSRLRNELIIGTDIDEKNRNVVLHLKTPSQVTSLNRIESLRIKSSLNVFYDIIIQNFKELFYRVRDVFLRENITYMLGLKIEIHSVLYDDVSFNELRKISSYNEFAIKLYIDKKTENISTCLISMINLYKHVCKIINIPTEEYPLIINRIETGSLWLNFIGEFKAAGLLKEILTFFLTFADKNYSTKGKLATIGESSKILEKLIDTKVKLNELGIETNYMDKELKNTSFKLAKELNTLVSNTSIVKIENNEYLLSDSIDE